MLRQSSSRNHRSKKLRPRHSLQALLLLAVGVWIVYQLTRSHGKRRAVIVDTDDGREAARRWLGRKGFVGDASSGVAVVAGVRSDDHDEVGSQGAGWGAASSVDPLSKTDEEGGDEEEEDLVAAEGYGADDADDAIGGDEEDDDEGDLLFSQSGNGEDELKFGGSNGDDGTGLHEPKELNSRAVTRAKATGSEQDAAAGASQQRDATQSAEDGRASATDLRDSILKNASSENRPLHDRGTAGAAAKKSVDNQKESTKSQSWLIV